MFQTSVMNFIQSYMMVWEDTRIVSEGGAYFEKCFKIFFLKSTLPEEGSGVYLARVQLLNSKIVIFNRDLVLTAFK